VVSDLIVVHSISNLFDVKTTRPADFMIGLSAPVIASTHQGSSGAIDYRICTDGSKVTRISFSTQQPGTIDLSKIVMRVKGDPSGSNPDHYGKFYSSDKQINGNTLVWTYTHPACLVNTGASNYRDDHFQILLNGTVLYEYRVRFITPPVVMVHGLWGEPSTFNAMDTYLKQHYLSQDALPSQYSSLPLENLLTARVNYHVINRAGADLKTNSPQLRITIDHLLNTLATHGIQCGKVDLVAHSMGGLVSRQYLVENSTAQVRKLITINTPHSGSQAANYLLSDAVFIKKFIAPILDVEMGPIDGGAVHDLKVGSSSNGVGKLNRASNLSKQMVPSHSIYSERLMEYPDDFWASNYLYTAVFGSSSSASISGADETLLWNILDAAHLKATQILQMRLFKKLGMHIQLASYMSSCLNQSHAIFTEDLFGGADDDLIVPVISQKGGLTQGRTYFVNNQKHIGSPANTLIMSHVRDVLRENPNNANVFENGFQPVSLSYDLKNDLAKDTLPSLDSVRIISPINDTLIPPGDSMQVIVVGSPGVLQIGLLSGNDGAGYNFQQSFMDTAVFNVIIGTGYPEGFSVIALGKDSLDKIVYDSIWIRTGYTPSVDSLLIIPEAIMLLTGQAGAYRVKGFFHDSLILDITKSDSLSAWVTDTTIAFYKKDGTLQALQAGNAQLFVAYQGDTVSAEVVVKPDYIVLTGDSAFCEGEPGTEIRILHAREGTAYQLFRNDTMAGPALFSQGDTLSFGIIDIPGRYSVHSLDTMTLYENRSSNQINLRSYAYPQPHLGSDTMIYLGDTLTMDVDCSGCQYLWSDGTVRSSFRVDSTGTYWVNVSRPGGCSGSDTLLVKTVRTGGPLYGSLIYGNVPQSPLQNTVVNLVGDNGFSYRATTDTAGHFLLNILAEGRYLIDIEQPGAWDGVEASDVLGMMYHFVDSMSLSGIYRKAGDVNRSEHVNAVDALMVTRRTQGLVDTFPIGDWVTDSLRVSVLGGQPVNLDIQMLWSGDVDASWDPEAVPGFSCGDSLLDTRDSQKYGTVQIGTQCWMRENLNLGKMVNSVSTGSSHTDVSDNGMIEKYCYYNDPVNCAIYGGLYDWNEMMGYVDTPGTQGICPAGWHIPNDSEWSTLEIQLGGSVVAGGALKETDTQHWYSPNSGATNSYGFTGLGSGLRYSQGIFSNMGYYANFWTSTAYFTTGLGRYLSYNSASVTAFLGDKSLGCSVRCMKD